MSNIALKWIGPLFDNSGYASASRSYIEGLLGRGNVDLTLSFISFENEKTTHGDFTKKVESLIGRPLPYEIQVVHATPENYAPLRDPSAYNIAYTTWETDKLPTGWTDECNIMDEIWVPSNWNKEVFARSGVTRPIQVIPHILELPDVSDAKQIDLEVEEDTYIFYSIFQWLARKNPTGLLKAYLSEFKANENVCLVLKTYRINTSVPEQTIIKQDIANIKRGMRLEEYPPIRFLGGLLSREHMKGLHTQGDCFVLPHCAEGFGIPHAEAMSYGKPVIATGYSGNLDFMDAENSLLVASQETPVCNMIFPHYNATMTWAEPSVSDIKKKMRWCFENRGEARALGTRARASIKKQLSPKKISDLIVKRLKEILNG